MDVNSELLGIAEIGVGMAGFAGVAAAILLGRAVQRDDQLRFLALFLSTIAVVLLAFTPILLDMAGLRPDTLWSTASIGFLVVGAGALPLGLTIAREAKSFETIPPKPVLGVMWMLFLLPLLAQALNLGGWLGGPGPLLYIAGLLSWLAAAAVLFLIIVLLRAPIATSDGALNDVEGSEAAGGTPSGSEPVEERGARAIRRAVRKP